MVYVFLTSVILFTGLVVLVRVEFVRNVRIGGTMRRQVDRRLMRWVQTLQYAGRYVLDFLNHDIIIKSLHIASYIALLLVRYAERRLVRLTVFFRAFRKQKTGTHHSILHSITREREHSES